MKFEVRTINNFMNLLTVPFPRHLAEQFNKLTDKVKDGATLTVEIKVKSKPRSLSANGLCWVLCRDIAEELSKDGQIVTSEDVYREAIRSYGAFIMRSIPKYLVDDWIKLWNARGIGWLCDAFRTNQARVDVRCYVGSSLYDTKQMARLIDGLIDEAKALGLSVISEADKQLLLDNWDKERET